ncbi:MAG: hypothetical protein HKN12_04045, partial [Gemmatimonadetes bacterium]|nr:hypothetical protein [Gemmatimonadota bacterium]
MTPRAFPAAIVLVAALFFAPELFGNRLAVTGNLARWLPWAETATEEQRQGPNVSLDCNLSYYPRREILHRAWRDGEIPFWNPYSFGGTPFLGDIQAGVLYPPNWILFPLEPGRQMGWFLFFHVAWAGIGVYLLARRCGVPPGIAWLAGCAFMMNGFFAKHYGQPTFLATVSWMPWLLYAGLGVLRSPTPGRAAGLALAGAGSFLAGQPQLAILGGYATAVVLGAAYFTRGRADRAPLFPVLVALVVAAGVAGLIVAAQLLPTRALAETSARAALPYATVLSGALHPVEGLRLLVPEFFGSPLTGDEWSPLFPRGDGFYLRNQMSSVFVGTPLFLLAVWGMVAPRTRRRALPFTLLFVAAVALAFGSPLARWAYEVAPGFRFSRIDRAGSLVVLAQIVPAALGASDLAAAGGRARRAFGIGAAALLIAL